MNKKVKYFLAASLSMFVLVAAGCGASQTAVPAQNGTNSSPTAANMKMPKEDPNLYIKEMRQTLAIITEQSKLNKLEEAKKAAADLITLQAKLAVHITDAKQKDSLRQATLDLQAEVQKPSPSQSAIDKQVEVVKNQLNDIGGPMQTHIHH